MKSSFISMKRLPEHLDDFYEVKDPSLVTIDGDEIVYTSIGRSDKEQWKIGRFKIDPITGLWQEIEPVVQTGLCGPQLCAPAIAYNKATQETEMFVQQYCFDFGGIHHGVSKDGIHFHVSSNPIISPEMFLPEHNIKGAYDVSITNVLYEGKNLECMTYTGIRHVGDGDIYLSERPKNDSAPQPWSKPQRIIAQEDISCHNQHGVHHREWCLEGMNLLQISKEITLAFGVCFLPYGSFGERQRVFMAAAENLYGPYTVIDAPLDPRTYGKNGENGHPDVIDRGDHIQMLFQARDGDKKPWHLREMMIGKDELCGLAEETLSNRTSKQHAHLKY